MQSPGTQFKNLLQATNLWMYDLYFGYLTSFSWYAIQNLLEILTILELCYVAWMLQLIPRYTFQEPVAGTNLLVYDLYFGYFNLILPVCNSKPVTNIDNFGTMLCVLDDKTHPQVHISRTCFSVSIICVWMLKSIPTHTIQEYVADT